MEQKKDGMGLAKLKEEYETLQKKEKLPSFREMNEEFYIEKLADSETEMLIREVRRVIGDKCANYMRFLENIINPVNAPMFVFGIIKSLNQEDKKKLSDIYKKLMQNEVQFIERDLDYDETKEAEFVRDSFKMWQEIKPDLLRIFEKAEKSQSGSKQENSDKGYFG